VHGVIGLRPVDHEYLFAILRAIFFKYSKHIIERFHAAVVEGGYLMRLKTRVRRLLKCIFIGHMAGGYMIFCRLYFPGHVG
jgi:hypothetical protein